MREFAMGLLLIPAAALALGALLRAFDREEWAPYPILASCGAVTALSFHLAAATARGDGFETTLYSWMASGSFAVEFGLRLDGLSAAVLAMVSFVGALIHLYAVGYMREERGFGRFFLLFHFFYLSMIGLLVSNNYIQMYLFWEGVGAASYLLIGFWFEREAARRAALKAFLVNRVGDAGFLLGVLLLAAAAGTVNFSELFARLGAIPPGALAAAAFLLAWGAAAKSAQFPLYIWLPDAMEGPTPTSALMHAATMVTAGVFLLARSWPLLEAAPGVLRVLAVVGAVTALGAAIVAGMKTDLKRILAYSTVSHLGLMTMAIGLKAVPAAILHLIMHGFFKALLFLCAGNVLHALGKSAAGIEEVGGLRRRLPFTFWAFAVGAASLAGVFPLGGFFSKDRVLDAAWHQGGPVLFLAALLIAAAGAFYITRMFLLIFLGPAPRQSPPADGHESDWSMKAPVLLLAAGAAFGGLLTKPFAELLADIPGYAFAPLPPLAPLISAIGTACAAAGCLAAYAACRLSPDWDWAWRAAQPKLAAWLDGDFGWQGFVSACVAKPVAALGRAVAGPCEESGISGPVERLAGLCLGTGRQLLRLSNGLLNEYLWWALAGTAMILLAKR